MVAGADTDNNLEVLGNRCLLSIISLSFTYVSCLFFAIFLFSDDSSDSQFSFSVELSSLDCTNDRNVKTISF